MSIPGKGPRYYIGQAGVLGERRRRHLHALRGGYHSNSRLQRDFSRHGEAVFSFEVLLVCETEQLTFYEQLVVDAYAGKPLYNVHRVCVDTPRGVKRSSSACARMSAAHLGKSLSAQHRAAIGAAFRGRKIGPPSVEARKNMSAAAKARKRRNTEPNQET